MQCQFARNAYWHGNPWQVLSECKQAQEAFEANSNNSQDIRLNSPEQSHEDDENGVKEKLRRQGNFLFLAFVT